MSTMRLVVEELQFLWEMEMGDGNRQVKADQKLTKIKSVQKPRIMVRNHLTMTPNYAALGFEPRH